MTNEEIDAWLVASMADRRLSRSERQALQGVAGLDFELVRRKAFEIARTSLCGPTDLWVLEWLEDVVKASKPAPSTTSTGLNRVAEAYFSPGEECPGTILRLLDRSARSADICVFTITDDRLANAVIDAHRRGVAVRVITDNAKADDLGSDKERLQDAGIPLVVDRSVYHMHHKFAVFDQSLLLSGSYNWTRGAAHDNEENLIVTDDLRLIGPFLRTFERLWLKLA